MTTTPPLVINNLVANATCEAVLLDYEGEVIETAYIKFNKFISNELLSHLKLEIVGLEKKYQIHSLHLKDENLMSDTIQLNLQKCSFKEGGGTRSVKKIKLYYKDNLKQEFTFITKWNDKDNKEKYKKKMETQTNGTIKKLTKGSGFTVEKLPIQQAEGDQKNVETNETDDHLEDEINCFLNQKEFI
ncbi:hypothetical protein ABK040_013018 [Willaertia magna]